MSLAGRLKKGGPTVNNQYAWTAHVEKWKDCQNCPLGQQRDRICFARGTLPCSVLFIGEAPGRDEDSLGQPFKGPAGRLLDQIIERALPSDVMYVMTNLVLCFPREAKARGDNEPERGEILECRPRLIEFANIVQPRLVVYVGSLAEQYVKPICTGPSVRIDHPAYILARLPVAQKGFAINKCVVQIRNAWEDVIQSKTKVFKQWGEHNASPKTKRQELRTIYTDAEESDIPF